MAEASSSRPEPRRVKVRRGGARHRNGWYLLYDEYDAGVWWALPERRQHKGVPSYEWGWQVVSEHEIVPPKKGKTS